MINGYVTYQVASDIISDSPSDSDNQSEVHDEIQPEPDSPRSGTGSSLDSEDEVNDEVGKGMHTNQPAQSDAMEVTEDMATAGGYQLSMEDQTATILPTASVNVRVSCHALTLAAMPNIRETDVSISARNHEPHSFEQFVDTHDRRPLPDSPPPPNSELLAAMELVASEGVVLEAELETLVAKLGESAAVSFLVGKGATMKWSTSPLSSTPPLPPSSPRVPRTKTGKC